MPEQPPEFYNKGYSGAKLRSGKDNHYRKHWKGSTMLKTWTRIANLIPDIPALSVVDLGCGSGQFAHMLYDKGRRYCYTGYDFSSVAIGLSKQKKIENAAFYERDLLEVDYSVTPTDYYVTCETLEHIERDTDLLEMLQPHTAIIVSVPDHDSLNHARFFPATMDVVNRYSPFIEIELFEKIGKHYIFTGTTKGK